MNNIKLLLDEMLGHTAKWLRIFSIDTASIKPKNDDELIAVAVEEMRVLITKDEDLARRCKKENVNVVLLKSQNIEDQLMELKTALNLVFPFPENTRCPQCNSELKIVKKGEVKEIVLENILKNHEKFWLCKRCNKAYWEGSHWKNITRVYKRVNG